MSTFKFKSRWKEELVCISPKGQFILEHPMGILSVYLPPETVWKNKAPKWAHYLWPVLKAELEVWCSLNKAQFIIDENAQVFDVT